MCYLDKLGFLYALLGWVAEKIVFLSELSCQMNTVKLFGLAEIDPFHGLDVTKQRRASYFAQVVNLLFPVFKRLVSDPQVRFLEFNN